MSALGPQLAEALGGTWCSSCRTITFRSGAFIECAHSGAVRLEAADRPTKYVGTFSDGVEALAAKAREMGAA